MVQDLTPSYTIHECDEHFLIEHAEELAALCRSSFMEHAAKNINFGPISMTKERFVKRAKGNIGMYVVQDGKIIAFWNGKPDYYKKIVYGDILAVSPEYKGMHIGSNLSRHWATWLSQNGFHIYI